MQPISVFLPGESHGQRSLVGYHPLGLKESYTTEATRLACPVHWKAVYCSKLRKMGYNFYRNFPPLCCFLSTYSRTCHPTLNLHPPICKFRFLRAGLGEEPQSLRQLVSLGIAVMITYSLDVHNEIQICCSFTGDE